MVTRDEFLELLWKDVIASPAGEYALENIIANCKRNPDGPFGDVGAAIERLLEAGASSRDLRLIFRATNIGTWQFGVNAGAALHTKLCLERFIRLVIRDLTKSRMPARSTRNF
jgi:hypothetical protein